MKGGTCVCLWRKGISYRLHRNRQPGNPGQALWRLGGLRQSLSCGKDAAGQAEMLLPLRTAAFSGGERHSKQSPTLTSFPLLLSVFQFSLTPYLFIHSFIYLLVADSFSHQKRKFFLIKKSGTEKASACHLLPQ